MTVRVMAWNLENFKDSVYWGASFETPLLLKTLYPDLANPNTPAVDVFGVIEVYNRAGGGPPGRPLAAASLGAQGCIRLLGELEARHVGDPNTEWRLAAPLSLGIGRRDEAVGVFYNAKKVTFKGPDQWDTVKNAALPPPLVTAPGALPEPWAVRCSIAPSFFTPRVKFYTDAAYLNEITFPDDAHRRPCLTRFQEVAGGRIVDVLFFHTSPPLRQDPAGPQNPAFLACNYLAIVRELINPAMRPGVAATVVVGDFNIDANNANRFNNALGTLLAGEYAALLPPTFGGQQAVPTMQRERRDVITPPAPIPPALCDQFYWGRFSVDNALYRPKGVAPPGAALDLTRGTPVAPLGNWPSVMAETIGEINGWPTGVVRWQKFTSIRNWYQNRLRSDHVPVVIQI